MSMEKELVERFDRAIKSRGYSTRSEGMRDLVRGFITDCEWNLEEEESIAVITLVYGKDVKKYKLMSIQHGYPEISTMMHTHVEDGSCLEVYVVKGRGERIRTLLSEFRGLAGVKAVKFVRSACGV